MASWRKGGESDRRAWAQRKSGVRWRRGTTTGPAGWTRVRPVRIQSSGSAGWQLRSAGGRTGGQISREAAGHLGLPATPSEWLSEAQQFPQSNARAFAPFSTTHHQTSCTTHSHTHMRARKHTYIHTYTVHTYAQPAACHFSPGPDGHTATTTVSTQSRKTTRRIDEFYTHTRARVNADTHTCTIRFAH